jgi:hypothetical protein
LDVYLGEELQAHGEILCLTSSGATASPRPHRCLLFSVFLITAIQQVWVEMSLSRFMFRDCSRRPEVRNFIMN